MNGDGDNNNATLTTSTSETNPAPSAFPYRTYKLMVEYDGTNYCGFQRQTSTANIAITTSASPQKAKKRKRSKQPDANNDTIQDVIEKALSLLTGQSIEGLRVRGAGRTDKGVHALGQVVAFDYYMNRQFDKVDGVCSCVLKDCNLSSVAIARAINSYLPDDIVIRSGCVIPSKYYPFEARRNITLKQYIYFIRFLSSDQCDSDSIGVNSFRRAFGPRCWNCPWMLNVKKIQEACNALEGKHDFALFTHRRDRFNKQKLTDLIRFRAEILDSINIFGNINDSRTDLFGSHQPILMKFTAEAEGFRRGMVRHLVGYVVDFARGIINDEYSPKNIFKKSSINGAFKSNREGAQISSAPACGLYLAKVDFADF